VTMEHCSRCRLSQIRFGCDSVVGFSTRNF
jgi:hypothetical protein